MSLKVYVFKVYVLRVNNHILKFSISFMFIIFDKSYKKKLNLMFKIKLWD